MFNYYINNILVNNPSNWKDFEEVLEYDIEQNSFLYKYPLNLEFHGKAYQYLLAQNEISSCSYLEIRIDKESCGNYKNIFIGNIFLSDMTINRSKCFIKTPVQDNSFTSFINNNKAIPVQIREDASVGDNLSKNGVDINSSLGISLAYVDLFNPATGAYGGLYTTIGFYIYDCFKFLIGYLSDLKINFKSDYLDKSLSIVNDKDNVKRLILTTGENIHYGAINLVGAEPFVTLQNLLIEVNRFYPIGYYIDYTLSGTPTFVIEDLDFFRNSSASVSFNKLSDVDEKRATSYFYSNILIGGNSVSYDTDPTIYKFENTQLYTFGEEEYYFKKECNIDKTLNLRGTTIVDTNIINILSYSPAGILADAFTSYKDNLFFIEGSVLTTPSAEKAYKTANTNNAYYHYNDNLLNRKVIERLNDFGDIYYNTASNVYTLINASDTNFLKIYSFSKFVSDSDYQIIKQNILNKIEINIDNNGALDSGWIKSISRKEATGETKIELRA